MLGVVGVGGKILWGFLSDRIGRKATYTIGNVCLILGITFLIIFDISPSSSLPYFYALFFGMGYAVVATLPPLVTADFFSGQVSLNLAPVPGRPISMATPTWPVTKR